MLSRCELLISFPTVFLRTQSPSPAAGHDVRHRQDSLWPEAAAVESRMVPKKAEEAGKL